MRRIVTAIVRKTLVALVMAAAALCVGLVLYEWWAERRIEQLGKRATGVEMTLHSIAYDPGRGRIGFERFKLANPEGFPTAEAVHVDEIEIEAPLKSIFADEIAAHLVYVPRPELALSVNASGTNLGAIRRGIAARLAADPASAGSRRLRVQRIEIEAAVLRLPPARPGESATSTVLKNQVLVRDAAEPPLSMPELIDAILAELLAAAAESPVPATGGAIGPELRAMLAAEAAGPRPFRHEVSTTESK